MKRDNFETFDMFHVHTDLPTSRNHARLAVLQL